ncbi:hypothetical protein [Maridesulfovibrio bastinii]|uniref:hypothetical protein n=1 Tax=Maridesulfovibrio bastinii TaxID=47157 RepID=UPI0003FA19B6|nr:hypothetical protein [Maridesulfovibrio bastinii]
MKNYFIDELYEEDIVKITEALTELGFKGSIEGIFYLPVPPNLLQPEQLDHHDACGPYFMALETMPGALKMELLVRARNKMRCSCVCYANKEQRNHMINYLDDFLKDLGIVI